MRISPLVLLGLSVSLTVFAEQPDFWTARNSGYAVDYTKKMLDEGAFDSVKGGRAAAELRLQEIADDIGKSQYGVYNTKFEQLFLDAVDGMPVGAAGNGAQLEKLTDASKAALGSAGFESMDSGGAGSIHEPAMPDSRKLVDRYLKNGHAFDTLTDKVRIDDTALGEDFRKAQSALFNQIDKKFNGSHSGKGNHLISRDALEREILNSLEGRWYGKASAMLQLSPAGTKATGVALWGYMDRKEMDILRERYTDQLAKDMWRQQKLLAADSSGKVNIPPSFQEGEAVKVISLRLQELDVQLKAKYPGHRGFDLVRKDLYRYAYDRMLRRNQRAKDLIDSRNFRRSNPMYQGGLETMRASGNTQTQANTIKNTLQRAARAKGALPAVVIGAGVAGAVMMKGTSSAEAKALEDAVDYEDSPSAIADESSATLSD